jgi:hypothetical protein
MRRILALVVAAATLTLASVHAQTSSPDELVWHWFGICQNAKTMGVEVRSTASGYSHRRFQSVLSVAPTSRRKRGTIT